MRPNALPATRVPNAEKINVGSAKTRYAQTVRPADRRQSIQHWLRHKGERSKTRTIKWFSLWCSGCCLDFQDSTNINHARQVDSTQTTIVDRNKQTKTHLRSHHIHVFNTPTLGARKYPAQRKALFCILFWAIKRVWRLRDATRGLDSAGKEETEH